MIYPPNPRPIIECPGIEALRFRLPGNGRDAEIIWGERNCPPAWIRQAIEDALAMDLDAQVWLEDQRREAERQEAEDAAEIVQ